MNSRKRSGHTGGQRPAKRRRTIEIGQHRPDDDIPTPQAQANSLSSSAFSVRTLPPAQLPSLASVCVRVLADNLQSLSRDLSTWEDARWWLKQLPDALSQRVFAALRNTCPTLLSHGFITTYFLRGSSIILSDELPAVGRQTIFAIGDMSTKHSLRELELTGLSKIADTVFASVIAKLPSLEKLNLRGSTKVANKTIEAAAAHCSKLRILNVNYTSVPAVSLAPVLLKCKQLEVLKVAGIPNWTDTTCAKLWTALEATQDFELPNLRSLKIRQAPLSDVSVNPVLAACPNLERLDTSFTYIKNLVIPAGKRLEKLSVTSTKIPIVDLVTAVEGLPRLHTLAAGALGGGQGSTAAVANTTAMTLTDDGLRALTDALSVRDPGVELERVSLVGNTKLGLAGRHGPDGALGYFMRKVGRSCKYLNLANISSLRSSDLEGLLNFDDPVEGPPRLTHLNLNNTSVDDTAASYLSACVDLNTLELAGTKLSSAGLFPVIDACTKLEKLDLTSCRGVKVGERRRFFEVWEEEWKDT